jgi:hypothetical protein
MGPDLERLKRGPTMRLHAASTEPGPELTALSTGPNPVDNAKRLNAAIYTSKGPF